MLFLEKKGILLDLARQRIILPTEIDEKFKLFDNNSILRKSIRLTNEKCEVPVEVPALTLRDHDLYLVESIDTILVSTVNEIQHLSSVTDISKSIIELSKATKLYETFVREYSDVFCDKLSDQLPRPDRL
jgi:hypothetical protein